MNKKKYWKRRKVQTFLRQKILALRLAKKLKKESNREAHEARIEREEAKRKAKRISKVAAAARGRSEGGLAASPPPSP